MTLIFINYILNGYSGAQNYKIENLQLGNQSWRFPCSKNIASAAMQPSITFGKVETDDGDFKHVELRQRLKRYKAAVIILAALLIGCMSTIAWLVFTSHYVCASDSEGSEANPDNNRVSLCLRKQMSDNQSTSPLDFINLLIRHVC